MSFISKNWQDTPKVTTPINAASLDDLENRLAAFTTSAVTAATLGQGIQVNFRGVWDATRVYAVGDGGAGTTIYQRRTGTWVGIV